MLLLLLLLTADCRFATVQANLFLVEVTSRSRQT